MTDAALKNQFVSKLALVSKTVNLRDVDSKMSLENGRRVRVAITIDV